MGGITARMQALAEGREIIVKADLLTEVLLAMSYEHHKVHDGELYNIIFNKNINAGGTAEIWVKTKNSLTVPHIDFLISASAGSLVEVIKDSTKTYVGGNALAEKNHNHNFPDTGVFAQVCHTPGGVETSTDLRDSYRVGGFKTPGTREAGEEHILAPSTAYLIRVTADGNDTDVNIKGTYYQKEDPVNVTLVTTTSTSTTTTT